MRYVYNVFNECKQNYNKHDSGFEVFFFYDLTNLMGASNKTSLLHNVLTIMNGLVFISFFIISFCRGGRWRQYAEFESLPSRSRDCFFKCPLKPGSVLRTLIYCSYSSRPHIIWNHILLVFLLMVAKTCH